MLNTLVITTKANSIRRGIISSLRYLQAIWGLTPLIALNNSWEIRREIKVMLTTCPQYEAFKYEPCIIIWFISNVSYRGQYDAKYCPLFSTCRRLLPVMPIVHNIAQNMPFVKSTPKN